MFLLVGGWVGEVFFFFLRPPPTDLVTRAENVFRQLTPYSFEDQTQTGLHQIKSDQIRVFFYTNTVVLFIRINLFSFFFLFSFLTVLFFFSFFLFFFFSF